MTTRWVIGLAAGPSADGIDAALLDVTGQGLALKVSVSHWLTEPFPRDLRELVVKTSTPGQSDVRQVSLAHRLLGEMFAVAAAKVADRASISLQSLLCIGCSGYSSWHEGEGRWASTLSLGAPAIIAERTGLTTLGDFRYRDLASGGQGSPITVLADQLLFQDPLENRLLFHLGGIAQVVYLPAGSDSRGVVGWEAGPCNVLLDCLIQQATGGKERFDAGGRYAVQGKQIPELLSRWANHPFLLRRHPRSTHRSAFAEEFARQTVTLAQQMDWSFHDLICTANHFIVQAIVESVRRCVPKDRPVQSILLSGGGVRNGLLWRLLQEQFPASTLEKTDRLRIPAEAKDAVGAGVLACLALDGFPANMPSATGAAGSRILGSFTPGSRDNWSQCLAWMTGRGNAASVHDPRLGRAA